MVLNQISFFKPQRTQSFTTKDTKNNSGGVKDL